MGLRELCFVPVVCLICLISLRRPIVGMYGYLWYALMRPDLLAFVDNKYPFSLILAITTGLGILIFENSYLLAGLANPFSRLILVMQVPIGMSVLFAVNPDLTYERYDYYIRMILVLLLIPVLVRTVATLRATLCVMAFSLGVVAAKFGVYGVIHGGVSLAVGYGDMLADNNFVALAFSMLIPLCWYCRAMVSSKWLKLGLTGIIGSAIAAVVMSNSRGGSLAMALGILIVVMRTKRKVGSFLLLAVFLGGAIYLVQDMFVARMSTLQDYQKEGSAESRIIHAKTALNMWMDYPIVGVGFGGYNYGMLSTKYMQDMQVEVNGQLKNHVAHNSYLQMLVDSGPLAFLLYTGALIYAIVWLGRSAKRMKRLRPDLQLIPRAIQIPLIAFAFGSAFYSCQRMDIPYMFLMCAGSWYGIERNLLRECEAAGEEEESPDAALCAMDAQLQTN